MNYDAILIVSFGGPEGMDDVMPFLENVLRGRNVPRERMLSVAHHYEMFNGVSPINQQNRNLIAALQVELERNGPKLPIYWGNRNWRPLLADTLRQMAADGIENALAFVTSAYSSYSSCRQYRQNIADAQAGVGPSAPRIDKLRTFTTIRCSSKPMSITFVLDLMNSTIRTWFLPPTVSQSRWLRTASTRISYKKSPG